MNDLNSYEDQAIGQTEGTSAKDGPGFFIGGEAYFDLGQRLSHIEKRLDLKPVYKPVGGTVTVPAVAPASIVLEIPILPARGRVWNILKVILAGTTPIGPDIHTPVLQAVSAPAVPASTVAQQNTSTQPVLVTLTGFTATQVFVNGVQVGTGNGTYLVPAGGSISITYTVQGTWTWAGTSTTVTADVYAGSLPVFAGVGSNVATVDNAILGNLSVPSVTNITKGVDWCSTGGKIFAILYGVQANQQVSLIARVAEYPVEAVEAMSV